MRDAPAAATIEDLSLTIDDVAVSPAASPAD